jgi:hypothetical protein
MRDLTTPWIRRTRLALAVGLLVCGSAALAQSSGNYSANCGKPDVPSFLGPGTWNGTFEIRHEARLEKGEVNLPLVIEVGGKIRVTAGESGAFQDASGELGSSFGGTGTGASGSTVGTYDQGTAPLSYDKESSRSPDILIFKGFASGAHRTRGDAPGPVFEGESGYARKSINLTLRFESFSCDLAIGSVTSPEIDDSLANLEGGGYVVTRGKSSFRLKNETEVSKEVAKLRKELGKVTPSSKGSTGDSRAREEEGKRLEKIKDRIRDGPPELIPCLTSEWLEHVEKLVTGYVQEDVNALDAWDPAGAGTDQRNTLVDLSKRGLATTRLICQIKREGCSADLLSALLKSMEAAHVRLLRVMIRDRSPPQDILNVLRGADLVGGISPALRDEAIAAVIAEADKQRKALAQVLAREMAKSPRVPCAMAIANAFVILANAEREYEVIGGKPPRTREFERALAACPDLPAYSNVSTGPRGAPRPPQE